jgi:hypothetical protein
MIGRFSYSFGQQVEATIVSPCWVPFPVWVKVTLAVEYQRKLYSLLYQVYSPLFITLSISFAIT